MDLSQEYTYQNHFKFGYDGQWYVNRKHPMQTWACDYGVAEHKNFTVKQANADAARKIQQCAQSQNLPIYLLLSGGLDSEVAARAFIDAGVSFTAVVMKYKSSPSDRAANFHESQYADIFCKKYNIEKIELILDVKKFYNSDEVFEIAEIAQVRDGQLACTMWAARQLKGYVVLGQGEPYLYRQFGQWWFREKELIVSWHKFWMFAGITGTAGFHQYTPDQILAYITDPIITDLVSNNQPATVEPMNNAGVKHLLYYSHYSDSDFLTRKKYTGFEEIADQDNIIREKLKAKYSSNYAEHTVEYHSMVKKLRGEN